MLTSPLVEVFNHEQIRYSMVWEDPGLLIKAMSVKPNDKILSIGSAGCNSLALLAENPQKVVCLDMNPAQIQLIELKKQAIKNLSRGQFLKLFQYRNGNTSLEIYENLRPHLKKETRQYWDYHQNAIQKGIIHTGRLESYFNKFRELGLRPQFGDEFIAQISSCENISAQQKMFTPKKDEFKKLMDLFFNKDSFSREGRDARQYKFVKKTQSIETILFQRTIEILYKNLISENPYLYYIFNGQFEEKHLPHYLQEKSYLKLQQNIQNLEIVQGDLEGFLAKTPYTFNHFNLSDIFEYVSVDHFKKLMDLIMKKSHPASRICHWNLFVSRLLNETKSHLYSYLKPLSESLHQQDEVWFYESFHVYQTR